MPTRTLLSLSLAGTLVVLGACPPAYSAPFAFETAPGRLPKDVVPLDYTIAITPDIAHLTIDGREKVVLDVRKPTATIVFNSLHTRLADVRLDGRKVVSVASDDATQLTTVTLGAPAKAGRHVLSFTYRAHLEEQPQGLFVQQYSDPSGKPARLLTSQFEATDARRMFPCWDEPAFRATYELTATVPSSWTVVSNMPVARRTVKGALATSTFERTPRMPSYLVEFSAGDLASVSGTGDGVPIRVFAVRGREHEGTEALASAAQILADYNAYFAYRYPLPKLDSIGVPGGFQGAMENWGAITYNDQTLLVDEHATTGRRQGVFSIQAHEMAHQWFGDLVTMGWWDQIWLNESFASWMAAKETALRHPDWNWWEGEDASKETAMAADSSVSSHAIEREVKDELQATNSFDPAITYNKGEAVLRMFEAYLGEDGFRDGVRAYMQARAYSNATATDLWNALGSATHQDVAQVAAGWTTQPGFPLVSVASECSAGGERTLKLSQSRFLLGGTSQAGLHWSVPLQVRTDATSTPVSVLLTQDGQTLAGGRCDAPLSVNAAGVGYYRSSYDARTMAANTAQFARLPSGDQIALLDDEWALVEAGSAPLGAYLALVSGLGDSLNTRAWEQASGALETIERALRDTPKHAAYLAYARSALRRPFDHLGWQPAADETPDIRRLRRTVIEDLGNWGDPEVLAGIRTRYEAYSRDRGAVSPDDQGWVLRVTARTADEATFESLHQIARSATTQADRQRAYTALMQVLDPALAQKSAAIALSPEIPPEAEAGRLSLVAQLATDHARLSWTTLQANYDRLLAPQVSFASLIAAQYLPQIYGRDIPLAEVESFVRSKAPAEMGPEIERGLSGARQEIAQRDLLRRAADTLW